MEDNRTLEEMRAEMDAIDKVIQEKFRERMALSAEIARFKMQNGLPILDVEREKSKLDVIAKDVEDGMSGFTSKLYLTLTDLSKAYQSQLFEKGDDISVDVETD